MLYRATTMCVRVLMGVCVCMCVSISKSIVRGCCLWRMCMCVFPSVLHLM